MNKQLTTIVLSRYFVQISFILLIIVIPLGFEPKTHSLEGCCSNPTELRNQKRVQRYIIFLIWQIILLKYFSFFDVLFFRIGFFWLIL